MLYQVMYSIAKAGVTVAAAHYFLLPGSLELNLSGLKKAVIVLDDSQLLKGVLEGCVLGVIVKGETYGYEILSVLENAGFENLLEGTLYPVLTRLEKKGLISCRKAKSPFGPVRKYYSITESGQEYFDNFKASYERITTASGKILNGDITEGDKRNDGKL